MSTTDYERLLTLLADRATEGLDEPDCAELKELLMKHPEWNEADLELAAAALCLTDLSAVEPLPAHLRTRIAADAEIYFTQYNSTRDEKNKVVQFPTRGRVLQWAGWYTAAAGFALAAFLAWPRPEPPQPTVFPPSLATLREGLLAQPDLVQTSWASTSAQETQTVTGDIVWSTSKQSGYMRFRGLPVNNPRETAYQLWIFDVNQDEKYPIDGGVFSVSQTGDEVIIPITAKLTVTKPILFALTVEKPGGVVVSKRDKLILLAKPEKT